MTTWLITGGSGQLGTALANELAERGIDFTAPNSQKLDITNQLEVKKYVGFFKPEVIVNAAAWTDVDEAETNEPKAFNTNSQGPKHLAIASREIGARFVQVSTDYVFSGERNLPWDEQSLRNPVSVYGNTKSKGEEFTLQQYQEGSYILRTAWLYSASHKNFATSMSSLAIKNLEPIRVVNDQIGQPTFCPDLSKQLVDLLLSQAPVGIYHATNSGQVSWFEYAKEIFKQMGADEARVIPISTSDLEGRAERPSYSVLGHEGWARTQLSPMRNWKEALNSAMPSIISGFRRAQ
jgi:dTDP-4-dehydrorhamnose reductase